MNTHKEKMSLLSEMISFSIVDGKLHERELNFINLVATELKVSKEELDELFHEEATSIPSKSEFQRIQQFYRLALLMYVDGVLHEKEFIAINEIGVNMGLNPFAFKRVLQLMDQSPNRMIEPEVLLSVFTEQHN